MHLSAVFDWLARHRLEAGLTVRMSAAGLITFAVAHCLGLTQIYWAVLTAVIVMQASLGGSLKAMLDRLVGTIGGAGWGVAVTLTLPHQSALSTGLPSPFHSCRSRRWWRSGRAIASRRWQGCAATAPPSLFRRRRSNGSSASRSGSNRSAAIWVSLPAASGN